jgi:hypothetical protein
MLFPQIAHNDAITLRAQNVLRLRAEIGTKHTLPSASRQCANVVALFAAETLLF